MDKDSIIQEKIDQALQSMDGHTPAMPRPYLATRIHARLMATKPANGWDKLYAFITRPTVALASVSLILLLNILILMSNEKTDSTMKLLTDQGAEWQVYSNNKTSALYDIENMEP